jgi:hypothetical protein
LSEGRVFFSLPARRHFGGTSPLMGDPFPLTKVIFSLVSDIVDWLSGCKYGFIPYLQNN